MNTPNKSAVSRLPNPLAVLGGTLLFVSSVLAADFGPRCAQAQPQFTPGTTDAGGAALISNRGLAIAGVPALGR